MQSTKTQEKLYNQLYLLKKNESVCCLSISAKTERNYLGYDVIPGVNQYNKILDNLSVFEKYPSKYLMYLYLSYLLPKSLLLLVGTLFS